MTRAAAYDPATYWSKRLAVDEGLESVGWQGLGRSFNTWLYRRRAAVFRQVARAYRFNRRPPTVLELGPGNGFYVDLWSKIGVRELTGIDIAPPAVTRLRRRFPAYQFLSGDIGRPIALPPHAFDVVTAFDVLFHLIDEAAFDQALSSIARSLRPGGIVLITDLFPESNEIRLPHHRSRTAGRYREALSAVGLELDRRRPVFVLMHPWAEPRAGAPRRAVHLWWSFVERVAGHIPGAGAPLGATLYAADTILAPFVGAGPSTQLWALRRAQP
ncbi:MAG: class I SAM-dependent methyltransferase [Dehalococcoidia bacterium]